MKLDTVILTGLILLLVSFCVVEGMNLRSAPLVDRIVDLEYENQKLRIENAEYELLIDKAIGDLKQRVDALSDIGE